MPYPLKAYYGANTYAMLAQCARCARPYDPACEWHTSYAHEGKAVTWFLLCHECHGKEKK